MISRDIKRVIISGATSSIGIALCEECVTNGIGVVAIIRPESSKCSLIPKSNLIEIVESELSDYDSINSEGIHADAFFHLAWGSTNGAAARDNTYAQADNIQTTLKAVELAKRCNCKVFVGAGSQAEYGRTNEVLTGDTACNPETAYGMTKLCAGMLSRLMCRQKGIDHVWTRILSAYGPNCSKRTVITYAVDTLLRGEKPILSDGRQVWDFIYISDVARALLACARSGVSDKTYVIGYGKSKLLREFLEEARDILSPGQDMGFGERPYNADAVMHLECDISELTSDTGFVPDVDFKKGIKRLADNIVFE